MATPIALVAQYTMDSFYQNYKEDSQFFDLADFQYHAGATVSDFYRQEFSQKYAEARQDKSDEGIAFSADILVSSDLEVDGKLQSAKINFAFMSFPYDRQTSGIQIVVNADQNQCGTFERTTLTQSWQCGYTGPTDRIFWFYSPSGGGSIKLLNKTKSVIKSITVMYVPGISDNMLVPDSIVDWTISNTVQKMKAMKEGVVIPKSIANNQNTILETEINKTDLKQ